MMVMVQWAIPTFDDAVVRLLAFAFGGLSGIVVGIYLFLSALDSWFTGIRRVAGLGSRAGALVTDASSWWRISSGRRRVALPVTGLVVLAQLAALTLCFLCGGVGLATLGDPDGLARMADQLLAERTVDCPAQGCLSGFVNPWTIGYILMLVWCVVRSYSNALEGRSVHRLALVMALPNSVVLIMSTFAFVVLVAMALLVALLTVLAGEWAELSALGDQVLHEGGVGLAFIAALLTGAICAVCWCALRCSEFVVTAWQHGGLRRP